MEYLVLRYYLPNFRRRHLDARPGHLEALLDQPGGGFRQGLDGDIVFGERLRRLLGHSLQILCCPTFRLFPIVARGRPRISP